MKPITVTKDKEGNRTVSSFSHDLPENHESIDFVHAYISIPEMAELNFALHHDGHAYQRILSRFI